MKKRILTTFLAGILCFSLFTLAGCSVNSGVVELYDSSVTIEFDNWRFTSGASNNLITIKTSKKNIVFECSLVDGVLFLHGEGSKKISVMAGETFLYAPFNPSEKEFEYIVVIKKENENNIGYALIWVKYTGVSLNFQPKVIKNVKFLTPVAENTLYLLIDNTIKGYQN